VFEYNSLNNEEGIISDPLFDPFTGLLSAGFKLGINATFAVVTIAREGEVQLAKEVGKDVAENVVKKGPYSHLGDPGNVRPGNDFTALQKKNIYDANRKANNGVLKSDISGKELVSPQKSVKGVTPPKNEAQIDHITPRNPLDPNIYPGTNSYGNAQVLSREENRLKSNR
jgi:hypothetical protein